MLAAMRSKYPGFDFNLFFILNIQRILKKLNNHYFYKKLLFYVL